jgi:hypothetical protein
VPGARLASSVKPITLEIALLCSAHKLNLQQVRFRLLHAVRLALSSLITVWHALNSQKIPLKNQKEQDGVPQIVRVCTARHDNTVIFDLAMEYLVEL